MLGRTSRIRRLAVAAVIAALPLLSACDDDDLMPPTAAAGSMFLRYVSIGNSITAGFQSGGINDSTQVQSYAVLVAQQMGTEFNLPLLNKPGCPPPITNIFTLSRLGGGGDTDCAFRATPVPAIINNVAVPAAQVADILMNSGDGTAANALTQMILGGRTQMEAAADAEPTFISIWIGNNDVLGAALTGDGSDVTDPTTFASRYNSMMQQVDALGVQGGILIGVANVTAIPHVSPGVAYFGAAQQGALPPTFTVDISCSPSTLGFGGIGEQVLVPFGYGFGVLLAQASQGVPVTLNCATDAPVLSPQEVGDLVAATTAYNQTIQQAANSRGFAYLDVNVAFDSLVTAGEIPLFPNPQNPAEPFGKWFSQDGFHPSAAAHRLLAQAVIQAINAQYGTSIPQLQ